LNQASLKLLSSYDATVWFLSGRALRLTTAAEAAAQAEAAEREAARQFEALA
jgi:hypothetical protein